MGQYIDISIFFLYYFSCVCCFFGLIKMKDKIKFIQSIHEMVDDYLKKDIRIFAYDDFCLTINQKHEESHDSVFMAVASSGDLGLFRKVLTFLKRSALGFLEFMRQRDGKGETTFSRLVIKETEEVLNEILSVFQKFPQELFELLSQTDKAGFSVFMLIVMDEKLKSVAKILSIFDQSPKLFKQLVHQERNGLSLFERTCTHGSEAMKQLMEAPVIEDSSTFYVSPISSYASLSEMSEGIEFSPSS